MTTPARECWWCDGRLTGQDGVSVPELGGGIVVHTRCLSDLGISVLTPIAASEREDGPTDQRPKSDASADHPPNPLRTAPLDSAPISEKY